MHTSAREILRLKAKKPTKPCINGIPKAFMGGPSWDGFEKDTKETHRFWGVKSYAGRVTAQIKTS